MAYVAIPDIEIQPGKPVTQVLQHKFRDNPEAVWSNDPTAPPIDGRALMDGSVDTSKLVTSNAEVSIGSAGGTWQQQFIPGGYYSLGYYIDGQGDGTGTNNVRMCEAVTSDVQDWIFSAMRSGVQIFSVRFQYISTFALYHWIYELTEKIGGALVGRYYSQNHPSWGHRKIIDVPFPFYNPALHNCYVTILDDITVLPVLYGQIPTVSNGYLTPAVYDTGLYDVNYFSPERSFLNSFDSIYTLDYGTPAAWPVEPIPVALSNPILGNQEVVSLVLPQPPTVNCVGVNSV